MNTTNLCLGCMEERGLELTCLHCGYKADVKPESLLHLPPGFVLQDKYLLGRVLGQGGFGITYLAWDLTLNIKLAIKEYLPQQLVTRTAGSYTVTVYKPALTEDFNYGLTRFLEEARTLARFIEHPNVVSVRDYFEDNGTAYLVMSYYEGLTLQSYLANKGGTIPVEQALSIFMPVLDALREVHASGILHRDISPDNLLIDVRGRVIVIDFGAARQAVREKSMAMSVILKAGYAPEEQHRSKGDQGPWTDVYAVSATFYKAITGEKPPEAIDRLAEDTLIWPSKLGVQIDESVERIIIKGLAIRAKDRYQSITDFQQAFIDTQAESAAAARDKYKSCPHCGELIHHRAVKCKYCYSLVGIEGTALQAKEAEDHISPVINAEPVKRKGTANVENLSKGNLPVSINTQPKKQTITNVAKEKSAGLKADKENFDPFDKQAIFEKRTGFDTQNSMTGTSWQDLQKESVAGLIAFMICIILAAYFLFASLGESVQINNQLAIAISLIAVNLSIAGLIQAKDKKTIPLTSLIFSMVLLTVAFANLSGAFETSGSSGLFTPESRSSSQIEVPGDYPTIQEAINNATNGSVITVAEGTYRENINFNGKEISLRSTDPSDAGLVAKTIIDGGNNGPVVTFSSGEGRKAVLSGFTITGGSGVRRQYTITSYDGSRLNFDRRYAGGILISGGSSPTVTYNQITRNQVKNVSSKVLAVGGGIAVLDNASPLVENNMITDNYSEAYGGGIAIWYRSNPVIKNNIINSNRAGDIGGGIMIAMMCKPEIANNIIKENRSSNWSGGIYVAHMSEAQITGNEITYNSAVAGAGLFIRRAESVMVRNNVIKDNKASGNGGAIYIDNRAEATVSGNQISGNTAKSGGGIWVDSDSRLRLSSPDDNSYQNNKPGNIYRK